MSLLCQKGPILAVLVGNFDQCMLVSLCVVAFVLFGGNLVLFVVTSQTVAAACLLMPSLS